MKISAKMRLTVAIEELLQTKKLDDITVSEIVAKAGVSRKTFYRNFQDKYDLMATCFEKLFENAFQQITYGEDFDVALLRSLEVIETKAIILRNAYSSKDINGLRNIDVQSTRRTYQKYLLAKGADIETPEMRFAIDIASTGGTDMVIEWLMKGMPEGKERLRDLIKRTLPNDLLRYLK